MKRKISLLMVLAMILSLVPMSAFAATANSVNKVPQVKDDYKFTTGAPELRIEEDNKGEYSIFPATQVFRLKLDNAEWLADGDFGGAADAFEKAMNSSAKIAGTAGVAGDVFISRLTDTTVEVTVYGPAASSTTAIVDKFALPVEVQGKGDVKVTVDPRDSVVTGGTYTFAVASSGDTVATIESVEDFTDNVKIKDIEIDETKIGAIGTVNESKIKLKLPSDFKWTVAPTVSFTGGLAGTTLDQNATILSDDKRTIELEIDTANAAGKTRGTIYLKNAELTAENDADYGDVEVSISGDDITSQDLVVAKYSDYSVVVKADGDAKELIAGEMASNYNDDKHKLQTLVIDEEVANAWLTERKTRIEFPKWVKILGVEITDDSAKLATNGIKGLDGVSDLDSIGDSSALSDQGENYVEFTATKTQTNNNDDECKIYLKFFVSVEAGKSGDITATVDGRSLGESYEVVLGKAIAPVEVKAEAADVRTGIKNQEIGKITITENKVEAIKKGKLEVVLDDNVEWKEVPTIKVTEGNLDVDVEGASVEENVLTIPVDSDSSKVATIEITNAELDLDRTVAEGDIDVEIKGTAVVENYDTKSDQGTANTNDLNEGYFDEDTAAKCVVARVITPADANTKAGQEVKFVIGNDEYQVGEEVKTADVAPYINNGRTMLSLRYVAEAMGVNSDSIVWNGEERSVTIFKGDRVAKVVIGSKELMVNGTPVMMDTVAEIKDGRTCLPVSFVAKALGAEVAWDGATRTVTIK